MAVSVKLVLWLGTWSATGSVSPTNHVQISSSISPPALHSHVHHQRNTNTTVSLRGLAELFSSISCHYTKRQRNTNMQQHSTRIGCANPSGTVWLLPGGCRLWSVGWLFETRVGHEPGLSLQHFLYPRLSLATSLLLQNRANLSAQQFPAWSCRRPFRPPLGRLLSAKSPCYGCRSLL